MVPIKTFFNETFRDVFIKIEPIEIAALRTENWTWNLGVLSCRAYLYAQYVFAPYHQAPSISSEQTLPKPSLSLSKVLNLCPA